MRRTKGIECTHWKKDVCLTIVEGPGSSTKELEIDMVGAWKPLKVTKALWVSFSQEQRGVLHPQEEKRDTKYYRSKENLRQKASSREGIETRPKPVIVESAATCFTNLSQEIVRSKWPSGQLFLCAVRLSEACVKLFVLCILPRGMEYFY